MWLLQTLAALLCITFADSQYYLKDQTRGCDGVIGSGKKLDRCGECGGDNTSCRVVSGIFTKRTNKAAYEYITEFPVGAENINITEARNTRNYLALRFSVTNRSIINGNWSLDWAGEYNVSGSKLIYKKPRDHGVGETIFIRGPIQQEIQLLLLVQTRNPGIYYRYTLSLKPKGLNNSSVAATGSGGNTYNRQSLPKYLQDSLGRPLSQPQNVPPVNSYQWRVVTDEECSRPCGEGYREQRAVCVLVTSKATVTDENCRRGQRPEVQRIACNTQPCEPDWETGQWSECSATCGRSTQTRAVTCKQRISAAQIVSISAVNCDGSRKPPTVKMCTDIPGCYTWRDLPWSKCSARCGAGRRERKVECIDFNGLVVNDNRCSLDKPRHVERCYSSCDTTWYHSDWLNKCDDGCGNGNQTREIFCPADKDTYNHLRTSSLCGLPPETSQPCASRRDCKTLSTWFTGEWSQCAGDCAEAYQRRHVFCMIVEGTNHEVIDNSLCSQGKKPDHKRKCRPTECDQSSSLWFVTDWAECSVSCGDGYQRRQVTCLNKDKKEDNSCSQTSKPSVAKACSKSPCAAIEQYADPSCTDKYRSCQVVVQARLCKLSYYNNICCNSCRLAG